MLPALVGHCDNRSQAASSHSMPGNTMPIRGEYKSQSTWRRWVPTPIAIASKSIAEYQQDVTTVLVTEQWTVEHCSFQIHWNIILLRMLSLDSLSFTPAASLWLQCPSCTHLCRFPVANIIRNGKEDWGAAMLVLQEFHLSQCLLGNSYLHGPHRCGLLCYNQVSC